MTDTKIEDQCRPEADSAPRVLLCSDYLPPSDGGVEQVVQNLAENLVEHDFHVGVFTFTHEDKTFEVKSHSDIEFFCAPGYNLTDIIGLQSMISLSAVRDFRGVVNRFRPDIVHVHNRFFFTSVLGALYSLRRDYELITTMHLGTIDAISGLGGIGAKVYERIFGRWVLQQSSHVICVSRAVEDLAHSFGVYNTTIIRNAVDVDTFQPNESEGKSLLYIGRLVQNNGIQDLIQAVPSVIERHPDAEIHIVGSGPLEDEIRQRIRSMGLTKSVIIHDYVADISEMYDIARVFCRPSYSEGLPLTMLEAMSAGVPPIMTNIAGVPEIVTDHRNGILIQPGQPEEISMAIIELFDDQELASTLGRNARSYVMENLTWEQRTNKVIEVYNRVLNDKD
jgi:glycosyltransferase involved in cell wall biosynthesis